VGGAVVLELVGEQMRKAAADRLAEIGSVAQQTPELENEVAAVEAPGLAQNAIVTGEKLRELDFTLGSLTLGGAGGRP
jgi:hypothetical protein